MQLSKKTIPQLNGNIHSIPSSALFELPEKVLQFGTGVLLRGLPDYFIDKANKRGIFNGRIVMVKSTENGDADAYGLQDGLYTQCVKGIDSEGMKEEYIINASISRVLSARNDWEKVLECASNPQLQVIISNTTEVGIVLDENDNINGDPPATFPAKLLAFLHRRYQVFNADVNKGLVILPTELLTDNGNKLQSIVMELAHINKFDYAFIDWLENANVFCNTLVDRIVPGRLSKAQQELVEKKLGYTDELMIMSEVYSLWAIESANERVNEILEFAKADESVVITPDIHKHRELKLRLLNGTHTFSCGLAYLAGFETVREAMENRFIGLYVYDLMVHEIAPCIISDDLHPLEALEFANKVIDRFRNPFIDHRWINITMQYTHKMKARNIPLLLNHFRDDLFVPGYMALGFAAYLLFMKGETHPVQDDHAAYFQNLWKENTPTQVVKAALSNESLWGTDLDALPGFGNAVNFFMQSIMQRGVIETLREYQLNRDKVESHEA